MPFKQPTLDELERRRLLWLSRGKDGPGAYKRTCLYAPCSSVFYAERVTGRFCTQRHARNQWLRVPPKKCGVCKKLFSTVYRVVINGRVRHRSDRLWCSDKCRKAAWIYRQRTGIQLYSYVPSEYRPRFHSTYKPKRFRNRRGKMKKIYRW